MHLSHGLYLGIYMSDASYFSICFGDGCVLCLHLNDGNFFGVWVMLLSFASILVIAVSFAFTSAMVICWCSWWVITDFFQPPNWLLTWHPSEQLLLWQRFEWWLRLRHQSEWWQNFSCIWLLALTLASIWFIVHLLTSIWVMFISFAS